MEQQEMLRDAPVASVGEIVRRIQTRVRQATLKRQAEEHFSRGFACMAEARALAAAEDVSYVHFYDAHGNNRIITW